MGLIDLSAAKSSTQREFGGTPAPATPAPATRTIDGDDGITGKTIAERCVMAAKAMIAETGEVQYTVISRATIAALKESGEWTQWISPRSGKTTTWGQIQNTLKASDYINIKRALGEK